MAKKSKIAKAKKIEATVEKYAEKRAAFCCLRACALRPAAGGRAGRGLTHRYAVPSV